MTRLLFLTSIRSAGQTKKATQTSGGCYSADIAADDVASSVARVAVRSPLNGTIEIGGPEQFRFDDLIRKGLSARNDPREVIADPHARYFGTELSERALIPGDGAQLGEIRFAAWLKSSASQPPNAKLPSAAAATATKGA
jgi:uncharacterized protein YbjT (DUF2867 family)